MDPTHGFCRPPEATQHHHTAQQPAYEQVEQELAVCKLVLYNTYTQDVLADLLKMYATLVPQLQAVRHPTEGLTTDQQANCCSDTATVSSCATTSQCSSSAYQDSMADACTQTCEKGVGVPTMQSTSCEHQPTEAGAYRWDLMFYDPLREAAFGASFNSLSAATDLLQCGLLVLVLALASLRQSDHAHALFATLVAMLIGMAVLAGAALRVGSRMHGWYIKHREALILCLRTMLVVVALPAGQALLGRAQQPSTVLTNIALWAVPALTMRVRLSVHLVFQLAVLCAMLATVSCQHAMAPGHPAILLAQMLTLVVFGFAIPSGVLYTKERRNRVTHAEWGMSSVHKTVE